MPLILVSCAVPSPAQAPAEPLFRTTTRLVELRVLHEFTTDAALLTRKLGDVKEGGLSPEMAQAATASTRYPT